MLKNIKLKKFNKKAAKSDYKAVLDTLGNLENLTIADIGSGGGFYCGKFAEAVGENGIVFALDTQKNNLDFVENYSKENNFTNIKTVLVNEDSVNLKDNSVDIFFSRNSFHHISEPELYFQKLKSKLKENGKIIIIDYKKTSNLNFVNLFGHYSDENFIIESLEKAGYQNLKSYDYFKDQSFNIFSK